MSIKDSNAYALIQIANALKSNLERLMVEIDLHSGQALILEALWENNCQSQADLVRNLSVTPPTVYNLVVRLAKAGFVEMKECSADGRIVRVCLTEKGKLVRPEVERQWQKLEVSTFAKLSDTETMMLSLLLKKLRTVD